MLRHLLCLIVLLMGTIGAMVQPIALGHVQADQYVYMKTEGLKAFAAGNYADAENYFYRVVGISRATRPGSRDLALDLNSLAEVYRIHRRVAEAQDLYEEALSILRRIPGSERQNANVLENLGTLLFSEGKYREAELTRQEAMSNAEKSVGRNGLAYASILDQLGKIYVVKKKMRQAERTMRESLRIRERYVGPEDTWIEVSLNNLALLLRLRGKELQAEPLLKRSLQLIENAVGPDHPDVATVLFNLYELYRELRRYQDADACLRRALDIRIARLPGEDPDVIQTIFELGKLEMLVGNLREAEPLLQQSLDIRRKILPSIDSDLALTLETYSDLMNQLHRSAEATKFADEARRMRNTLKFTRPVAPRKPR
jgi:tetratricopeptide (TPR) repeat protein